jgi:hypothetical protein
LPLGARVEIDCIAIESWSGLKNYII